MGLDLSHGEFSSGYGNFHKLRCMLCHLAGLGDFNVYCNAHAVIITEDPLRFLLNHSDCGGDIHWVDCGALALRLRELAPKIQASGQDDKWETFYNRTILFAESCELAHEAGENLEFI